MKKLKSTWSNLFILLLTGGRPKVVLQTFHLRQSLLIHAAHLFQHKFHFLHADGSYTLTNYPTNQLPSFSNIIGPKSVMLPAPTVIIKSPGFAFSATYFAISSNSFIYIALFLFLLISIVKSFE